MMVSLGEVLNVIYEYYPKNVYFGSPEYNQSPQFIKLKKLRQKNLNNLNLGEDLKEALQVILKQYGIINWTDIDSSNCYEYRVLLHKNQPILDDDIELIESLGGTRFDLYLFVSILNNYYYYFVSKSMFDFDLNKWGFENIQNYNKEIQCIVDEISAFFATKGYEMIPKKIAETFVEDIDTEYIEKGKVKVFNCLFTELIVP
jgi:hypothetical protein